MFRKLNKNRKGQNTAEYALLIALVVAAIIAMQTYAQRALQARIRGATLYLANGTPELGTTNQYEPYYLDTSYGVNRYSSETKKLGNQEVGMVDLTNRTRDVGGFTREAFGNGVNFE